MRINAIYAKMTFVLNVILIIIALLVKKILHLLIILVYAIMDISLIQQLNYVKYAFLVV